MEKIRQDIIEDEVSLREIILKVKEYIGEIRSKIWIVLLAILLCGVFFGYKYMTTSPTYIADLTFMVDKNESGGFNALSSIISQFGLPARTGRSNLDKILAIGKSRRIIDEVLVKRATIDGREDFFANHIIDIYRLDQSFEDDPDLAQFRFRNNNLEEQNPIRDKMLNILFKMIVGDVGSKMKMLKSGYDESSSIMYLSTESISEPLSSSFTDSLFDHLSSFYIEQATAKALNTYTVFEEKTDSIYKELLGKQNALANVRDLDRGAYLRGSRLKRDRLIGEVEILTRAYAESYKNTEIASIDLEMKTPYITVIDRPRMPLRYKSPSLLKSILLAGVLGSVLGMAFVVIRKLFRDAMQES